MEPLEPRNLGTHAQEGRNLEPRRGFQKKIGAPMARPWNLEPGTYRNLLAEGSRNQNRGNPHGVEPGKCPGMPRGKVSRKFPMYIPA